MEQLRVFDRLEIVEMYQSTLDTLESVLLAQKRLYRVWHYETDESTGKTIEVLHSSMLISTGDCDEQEITNRLAEIYTDCSSIITRPYTQAEVCAMLTAIKQDLGLVDAVQPLLE